MNNLYDEETHVHIPIPSQAQQETPAQGQSALDTLLTVSRQERISDTSTVRIGPVDMYHPVEPNQALKQRQLTSASSLITHFYLNSGYLRITLVSGAIHDYQARRNSKLPHAVYVNEITEECLRREIVTLEHRAYDGTFFVLYEGKLVAIPILSGEGLALHLPDSMVICYGKN